MSNGVLRISDRMMVEYAEAGTHAGIPILSFHGTPGGVDGALVTAELYCGTDARLIGFSRPGYLGTPLVEGWQGVEAQARLGRAVLDALGVNRAVAFGLSGGGPYALAFAQHFPERAAGLVLVAAVTGREGRSAWRRELEILSLRAASPLLSQMGRLGRTVGGFAHRAAGYRNDAIVFGKLGPVAFEKITCPALIVHGEWDWVASCKQAREAASRIARCKTLFLPRTGHLIPWWDDRVKGAIGTLEHPLHPKHPAN